MENNANTLPEKGRRKKIILVVCLIVLLAAAVTAGLYFLMNGEDKIPEGETYQWTYKKPFGRETDEGMVIDGKLDEKAWEGQRQLVQMENGVKMTATTVFTEKGLYVGLEALDKNVIWKLRHAYGSNSSFKVIITKKDEIMYAQNNYGLSFPTTRHAFLEIDAKTCRSFRETPYQGKAYVDGELNSGDTNGISAELFLTWEDLHYTEEELGEDGVPEAVEIYVSYQARGAGDNAGGSQIAASFTKEWQFETYFHFDKGGLIVDYDSETVGHATEGPAASDQWTIATKNGKETATATEERLQVLWLKGGYSTDFIAETTILPLKTELNINNRCGFVVYQNSSTYNFYGVMGKTIASGNSVSLATWQETDAYHWENKAGASETVIEKGYTADTIRLKVIKKGAYLFYFYNDEYWGYEYIGDLEDASYVGLFTNGAATFSDWKYTDYSGKTDDLRKILSKYVYFVTTSGVKARGSVLTSLEAVKKGDSITLTVIPASGCILTDFTVNGKDMYDELVAHLKDGEYVYTPTCDVDFVGTFTAIGDEALVDTQILLRNEAGEAVHAAEYKIAGQNNPLLIYKGKPNSNGNIILSLPKAGTYKVGKRTLKVGGTYSLEITSDDYRTYRASFTLNNNTTSVNMDGKKESVAKDASYTMTVVLKENEFGGTVVVNGNKVTTKAKLDYNEATGNYYTTGRGCFTYFRNHVASQYVMNVTLDIEDLGKGNNLSGIAITGGKGCIVFKSNSRNPDGLIVATGASTGNTTEELCIGGFGGWKWPETAGKLTFKLVRFQNVILLYNKNGVLKAVFDSSGMKLLNGTTIVWGANNLETLNKRIAYVFAAGPENAVGMVKYGSTGRTEWDIDFNRNAGLPNWVSVKVTYLDGKKATVPAVFGKGLKGTLNGVMSHDFFAVATYLDGVKVDVNSEWAKYLLHDATLRFDYDCSTTNLNGVGSDVAVAADGTVKLTGRSDSGELADEANPLTPTEKLWKERASRAIWTKCNDRYSVVTTTVTADRFTNGVAGFAVKVNNALAIVGIDKKGNASFFSYQAGVYKNAVTYNVGSGLDWTNGVKMSLVQSNGTYYLIVDGKMAAVYETDKTWSYGWNAKLGTAVGFAQTGDNILNYSNYSYRTGEAAVKASLREKSTVTVKYLDGRTQELTALFGKGLQGSLRGVMSDNFFAVSAYLNGTKVNLSSAWDKYLINDVTLRFDYDCSTTNLNGVGSDVVVAADGTVKLTGRSDGGELADEANPLTPTEKLWKERAARAIWTKCNDKYSVVTTTVTADRFTNGVAGFAVKVNNALAIMGINKNGNASFFSYQAGVYKNAITYNVGSGLDWTNGVKMSLVQSDGTYYLLVNGNLAAIYEKTTTWSYGWSATIGTEVGFAQQGDNILNYTDYSYRTGATAVDACIPDSVKVEFNYPNGTKETISAVFGEGLVRKPKEVAENPFLAVYLNGTVVSDLESACKYLTADATVTYDYRKRTTNTTAGTGISMGADGKITLTGRMENGELTDEVNPVDKKKLWADAVMRQILVPKGDNYSVLKATVTSDNFTSGAVGFALTVNDKMAMAGIYKSGKAYIYSWNAGSNPEGAITYQTTKPLDWNNGVELVFVQNNGIYYLFANNELVLKFYNNVNWAWGWNGNVSWDMGFSQTGKNVVTFADYTFETGEEAVSEYLSASVQVEITYPDGTQETVTSEFGKGLAKEPTVGYDNPYLTVYLNGNAVSDLKEVCKYLREDATITYKYASRTTNKTPGTGIKMAADGTITLTGQAGNDFAKLKDEVNPADKQLLDRYSAMRQIVMPNINGEYWVLKTKVTSDNVMTYGGAVGFALTVNDKMAFVGIFRDGRGEVHSYAAGTNPAGCFKNADRELLKLNWTSGVELVLVRDNDTYHMYADGTEVVTFKSGVSWGWQTGVVSQPVGLAQRSPSEFNFTDYSLETGQDAVAHHMYMALHGDEVKEALKGKYVSVLGDSLSTYQGVSNSGSTNTTTSVNNAYYNGGLLDKWEETWWGQVISRYDMKLLVNNSSSDSWLSKPDGNVKAGYERAKELAANTGDLNGTTPDIVFLHMGTNDYVGNANLDTFRTAYEKTLDTLLKMYPNVDIYCLTLTPSVHVGNSRLEKFNGVIREIIEKYADRSVYLVDIAKKSPLTIGNIVRYTYDGLHYDKMGFTMVADVLERAMAHLETSVKVGITYPDGTRETIDAVTGKGLKTEPKVGWDNPFLTVYLNGTEVSDLKEACKNLIADATVTYKYIPRTTNTTAGTGIAMAADRTITLIGRTENAHLCTDEVNPVNANEKLWSDAVMRQILVVAKRDNYSVLKAKVTSDNFIDGAAGFALTVNGQMAMVGIEKSGKAYIKSWNAGDNPVGAITHKTTKPLKWENGVELAFVQNYGTYYLYANNELVLEFRNNVKWSWGWNGSVSWDMGFSQKGRNVLTFTDYSFATGQDAVNEYLKK